MNKTLEIALVGNPNSGKSSLFNLLTGLNQKVGNFPGVTVDKKTGQFVLQDDTLVSVIDLPGSYSLYPRRSDERISYEVLLGQDAEFKPDLVVIVVDASNLKRNLLYATQVLDLKIPTVMALTMNDVALKKGVRIDVNELSEGLGIPVVAVNPRTGEGLQAIKKEIATVFASRNKSRVDFFTPKQDCGASLQQLLDADPSLGRYTAFHLLVQSDLPLKDPVLKNKVSEIRSQTKLQGARMQGEEIIERYKKIDNLLSVAVTKVSTDRRSGKEQGLDRILLHPVWGYTILLIVLFFLFQSVFWIAEYPMTGIEHLFVWLEHTLSPLLPEAWYSDLILKGLLPGLSGILVFVPQIMILFGLIAILEETGYMARISFLTDKVMRKVGLNGKSVMPMISGFACAVPAIMSVRNIENQKERLLTILITPLMSCSARLPVYTILIALVIPEGTVAGFLSLQGLVMMGLYLLGIVLALLVAWIARRFIRLKEKSFFILELPLYKAPRWNNILLTMFSKARIFITDAGKVILFISLILWALSSYGPSESMQKIRSSYDEAIRRSPDSAAILEKEKESALLQSSYAGLMGRSIEPVIRPLGYDWKIGIALITSFAAREVFVGTMATLYSVDGGESDIQTLREKMEAAKKEDGTKVYSLATGVSLMLFYLLAMQCMSTLAVVKRETNSWKWPLIQLVYMSGLAYLMSFLAYQLLN